MLHEDEGGRDPQDPPLITKLQTMQPSRYGVPGRNNPFQECRLRILRCIVVQTFGEAIVSGEDAIQSSYEL